MRQNDANRPIGVNSLRNLRFSIFSAGNRRLCDWRWAETNCMATFTLQIIVALSTNRFEKRYFSRCPDTTCVCVCQANRTRLNKLPFLRKRANLLFQPTMCEVRRNKCLEKPLNSFWKLLAERMCFYISRQSGEEKSKYIKTDGTLS